MAKGSLKSTFKDGVVPTSGGSSDLELTGGAKTISGDFEIGGNKVVILVGEGELDNCLKELE